MRFDSEIILMTINYTENTMGDSIKGGPIPRKVNAEKMSIRQSEFYQAAASGFMPELGFKIWLSEYKDEPELVYNGKKYTIIRTYSKDRKELEIICQGVVNIGSS